MKQNDLVLGTFVKGNDLDLVTFQHDFVSRHENAAEVTCDLGTGYTDCKETNHLSCSGCSQSRKATEVQTPAFELQCFAIGERGSLTKALRTWSRYRLNHAEKRKGSRFQSTAINLPDSCRKPNHVVQALVNAYQPRHLSSIILLDCRTKAVHHWQANAGSRRVTLLGLLCILQFENAPAAFVH